MDLYMSLLKLVRMHRGKTSNECKPLLPLPRVSELVDPLSQKRGNANDTIEIETKICSAPLLYIENQIVPGRGS